MPAKLVHPLGHAIRAILHTPGGVDYEGGGEYPSGAVALINGSAIVANAAAVATLTPAGGKTAHILGFQITGTGSTAALAVSVTVTGLLGGVTLSYTYVFEIGALVPNKALIVPFMKALPASGIDTPIVVTCAAGGAGNLRNSAAAQGYYV